MTSCLCKFSEFRRTTDIHYLNSLHSFTTRAADTPAFTATIKSAAYF